MTMTRKAFYILAFVLAGVFVGYDYLLFHYDEWMEALRDTIFYVTLFGFFSVLFYDKIKTYKTTFEKGTLFAILVVILYKILIVLLSYISAPNDYYQFRVSMNNHIYDTAQVALFAILLSINLVRWVSFSELGRRISRYFSP